VAKEIHLYYEGHKLLKEGFSRFFEKLRKRAYDRRCYLRLIPAGSGSAACDRFGVAVRANKNVWNILLTDSEGPDTGGLSESLRLKYGWDKHSQDSIFWMVEMMESWLHADKDKLEEFYGQRFRRNALKANPRVEEISKADLENGLKAATKETLADSWDRIAAGDRRGEELLERKLAAGLARAPFHLTAVRDNGSGFQMRYQPATLRAALWQRMAGEVAGLLRCLRCPAPRCGHWFLKGDSRSDRTFCSKTCKVRAFRKQRKGLV